MINDAEARLLAQEFFNLLDKVEESDGGRLFHPTTITSCRVVDAKRLNEILPTLKAWATQE
jgi:hypothetical protein